MRVCEACSQTYVPANGRQRWCEGCRYVDASCETCGDTFRPKRSHRRRFCSKRCANTASARRGPSSEFWKGGVDIGFNRAMGRYVVYCRDGTQVLFSRAVMAGHLGRLLTAAELVHHRNEDPTDDRLENLELTTRADHARMHMPALLRARGIT